MNSWTVQTHRLKPRVEDDDNFTVQAWRRAGSRDAARLHALGQGELARSVLRASFEKQLRLIGLRDVHLPHLIEPRIAGVWTETTADGLHADLVALVPGSKNTSRRAPGAPAVGS